LSYTKIYEEYSNAYRLENVGNEYFIGELGGTSSWPLRGTFFSTSKTTLNSGDGRG